MSCTAAAADCWNLIEEKLPSILGDLNNDASLLLELAKQCERDDKIQLAIRLGMGALRREPEDNGRNNIYEYEGTYNTSAITATSSNQSAVTWLLQLITNTSTSSFSIILHVLIIICRGEDQVIEGIGHQGHGGSGELDAIQISQRVSRFERRRHRY